MVRMESALVLWIIDCRKKTLRWIRTLSAQKLEHCSTPLTPHDVIASIDADAHQLTDADLAEMTKPPSEDEREEDTSVDKDEEDGLTHGRLSTMLRMATEHQRAAHEWDVLMSRPLQFSNIIDGGMSVYKDLFAQK